MSEALGAAVPAVHPVRLRVTDDLERTRLTVFFRLLLAIPQVLWLALLGIVVFLVLFANWVATLITARSPIAFHAFLAAYLRSGTQVGAYAFLIADPYPGFFLINVSEYPVDLEIDGPDVQNRWTVAFRIVLAIPALLVASVLRYLSQLLAILSWFVALATARVPRGIRDFAALALRFESQTYAYAALVTPRYPNFNVSVEA
jgi:hypothetical protein